jgi:hypothetical protein
MIKPILKTFPILIMINEYFSNHRRSRYFGIFSIVLLILYGMLTFFESMANEKKIVINTESDYRNSRLIETSYGKIYKGKERILESKLNKLLEQQKVLVESIETVNDKTWFLQLKSHPL